MVERPAPRSGPFADAAARWAARASLPLPALPSLALGLVLAYAVQVAALACLPAGNQLLRRAWRASAMLRPTASARRAPARPPARVMP